MKFSVVCSNNCNPAAAAHKKRNELALAAAAADAN